MATKANISYSTTTRDTQTWSSGDVIFNLTTSVFQQYNGSAWIDVSGNQVQTDWDATIGLAVLLNKPSISYNVIQTTRRTVGSPTGYYPLITNSTNISLQYIGIDYPEVALKDTTLVDLWIQRLAPPITSAATAITSTTATLNWGLDTYWDGTSFVITPSSSYIIEYSTSSTFASGVTTVTGTALTYPVTGLTTATVYYFRVKVVNGDKVSKVSNTTSFTTI